MKETDEEELERLMRYYILAKIFGDDSDDINEILKDESLSEKKETIPVKVDPPESTRFSALRAKLQKTQDDDNRTSEPAIKP